MTIWTDLADLEFKTLLFRSKGIKTEVLEAGRGEPLIFFMAQGDILKLTQEISKVLASISASFALIWLVMVIQKTRSTIWN